MEQLENPPWFLNWSHWLHWLEEEQPPGWQTLRGTIRHCCLGLSLHSVLGEQWLGGAHIVITYSGMFIQNWTCFCSLQTTRLRRNSLIWGWLVQEKSDMGKVWQYFSVMFRKSQRREMKDTFSAFSSSFW